MLEEAEVAHHDLLLSVTVVTVALSVLLHGITAAPLANLYGRMAARMGKCEENEVVPELPLREGLARGENDLNRIGM